MNKVSCRHAFAIFMSFSSIILSGLYATYSYGLVMEAEDYSWAYDSTPGNRGGEYRDGDVDIGRSDDSNPFYVGWVAEEEWLAFDGFVVPKTGTYEIKARVASQVGGEFSVDLDAGSIQLGTFTVPNTGGWHNWETISMTVELTAGDYNFGLFAKTDGWNLNWIEVTPVASNTGEDVVWAVNAGGPEYQSSDGIEYLQDEGFVGGEAANTQSEIKATPDALLYQTERWGENFSYVKDLPNSTYSVTFRFAEIYWQSANQRQFSVKVEGETRLQNVDIAAEKGNRSLAAYDLTVPNIVVNDGQLNIDFDYIKDAAKVSAFVVREQRAPSPNWQLVWSDEFNNDGAVDGNKWTHELWAPGRVNNEWQRYTNRLENSRIENGKLIIEARKDGFMGDDYSFARIKSQGKGDLLYGRVEVRAKLPNGRGTWPAIWMMPTDVYKYATTCDQNTGWDSDCNAWPNSGEIDIMEHVGYDTGRVHGTVHNKAGYWVNG